MGYRGTVNEQQRALRDVPFTPTLGLRGPHRRPHPAHEAKLRQIEELDREGLERIGTMSEKEFLVAGAALYAGEGAKGDGAVHFANTDATMIRLFCAWLRYFFEVDESRLRVRVYLHKGLDLDAAEASGQRRPVVPRTQFRKAHRAVPDPSIRRNKHEHGCAYVYYSCSKTHRQIMGLIRALLSSEAIPG